MSQTPRRVLSGIRPTGQLHVGHILGALANWVALQDKYECFFMIADWHALTTHYETPEKIREWAIENTACIIASGVDPDRCVLFRQSDVPEHAELHLLLSMVTPVSWLERVPSYKEKRELLSDSEQSSYGLLGYPVLQAADILAYRASLVPVGEDQVAHLELAREMTRRFNKFYSKVFPEPQPMLTNFPRLPGIDRRKMSKSYGNSIDLESDRPAVEKLVKRMFTDPQKIHLGDKGHPEECVVFAFHSAFNPKEIAQVEKGCRAGTRGCVECKKSLFEPLWKRMEPVHEKRAELIKAPRKLAEILEKGAKKARAAAGETLDLVRKAMGLK